MTCASTEALGPEHRVTQQPDQFAGLDVVAGAAAQLLADLLDDRLGDENLRERLRSGGPLLLPQLIDLPALKRNAVGLVLQPDFVTWRGKPRNHEDYEESVPGWASQWRRSAAVSSVARSSGKNRRPPSISTTPVAPGMVSRSQ